MNVLGFVIWICVGVCGGWSRGVVPRALRPPLERGRGGVAHSLITWQGIHNNSIGSSDDRRRG